MRDEIDADQIHECENAGLGQTNGATQHGIGLFDSETMIECRGDCALDEVDAQPIANESWCVIAECDALAKFLIREGCEALQRLFRDFLRSDDFKQWKIARRIEEVSDEESAG